MSELQFYAQKFCLSKCVIYSGCSGAGITTPLDVAKTRIMLAEVSAVNSLHAG